jgi:hypothetical protein
MIQWEEVELKEATHVEIKGVVHEMKQGGKVKKSVNCGTIDILVGMTDWVNIPLEVFPILGIKFLMKIKPKEFEFEATFVMDDGRWRLLYSLNAYQNFKKKKFKCIEILEDEK